MPVVDFRVKIEKEHDKVEVIYINQKDLIENIINPKQIDYLWKFSVNENDVILRKGKEDGVFALPISEIISLMKIFQSNNANLFDKNIRSFLKNDKLSKQMEATLKNEPNKFHLYHNGITLIAKEKIVKTGNCYSVKNPQIVNGAQTVNSLFINYSQNPRSKIFSKAKILCKIVTAKDDFFEKKICETSNTQIPIKLSDLRTNDSEQLRIKKYIESISGCRYVYLLKRKTSIPKDYVGVTFEELMQWACAVTLKRPGYAKNNKKDIFDILLVDEKGSHCTKKLLIHYYRPLV